MFLYFSDWKDYIFTVPEEKDPELFIKIYASEKDPRTFLKKPQILVFEEDSEPLTQEDKFELGERGVFTGLDFEDRIKGLSEEKRKSARAIIRFAERIGIVKLAMERAGSFRFENPMNILHGLEKKSSKTKEPEVHLDILKIATYQHIIKALGISFISKDSFVGPREVVLLTGGRPEGGKRGKENEF